LYRVTGGRYPAFLGALCTVPLLTTGANSGQPREHQVNYFHDGTDAIVIASNYGGPKHPPKHPECKNSFRLCCGLFLALHDSPNLFR
jgi:hypothetical protein